MTCRRLWCIGLGCNWVHELVQQCNSCLNNLWRFFVAVAIPSLLSVLEQVCIANASYFYANKVVANWTSNIPYKLYVFVSIWTLCVKFPCSCFPCNGVLQMVVTQHIRILPAFYGIWMFILFSSSLQWTLSWASCIQSEPSYPISLRSL